MTNEVARRNIEDMELAIRAHPSYFGAEDNEHIQTEHFFAPGLYARQLTRKQGVLIVGKVHRDACLTLLLRGRLLVASSTDDVPAGTIVEAGAVWVSLPGTKRATYALEDSILITVHQNPTNTADLDELEAAIIEDEK